MDTRAAILAYLERLGAARFTGRVDIIAHFNKGGISRAWAMREESLSEAGTKEKSCGTGE